MKFTSFVTAMTTLASFAQAGSVGVDLFHDGIARTNSKLLPFMAKLATLGLLLDGLP